ncbi:hypothetical protein [Embleya sp. NBC_00896]|uniref:hypothetical protein n=1 Tax=Embleya sp. NBC_00896 TaxID=2975961 RepID=UPI00386B86E1|nr:hypothetical protein OG928_15630 [Embleya sp. NBC_00896]
MFRSKIARTLGVVGAAAALTAVAQGPASAATVNWSTSYPNLGNTICSSSTVLSQTGVQLLTCMSWGGGKVQSYTIAVNGQAASVLVPEVKTGVTLNSNATNTCAAIAMPASSSRFCSGPKLNVPAGTCTTMFAFTNYTWFTAQAQWSPSRQICA